MAISPVMPGESGVVEREIGVQKVLTVPQLGALGSEVESCRESKECRFSRRSDLMPPGEKAVRTKSFPGRAVAHGPVFHNSIHRYFVITLRIALTSMKQLFSFAHVDG